MGKEYFNQITLGSCYALVSLWASFLFVPLSIRIARKYSVLDKPGARKVHVKPTPRIGGLGFFSAFFMMLLFFYLNYPEARQYTVPLLLGGTLIFVLGLIDDLKSLGPRIKLLVELVAALILIAFNVRLSLFIDNFLITSIITVLWVVGITNAFNLLDNMDGLSAGLGCITSYFFFCVFISQHEYYLAMISLCFSLTLLGFLYYNFSPAKTFMGDCGSLFIGFNLSAIAIMGSYVGYSKLNHLPVITPLLLLSIPIYDTLSVIIIRYRNGAPIFQGDKNHFSHRLVKLGFSKRLAVLFIMFMAAWINLSTLLLTGLTREQAVILLMQTVIVFMLISILMYISFKKIKLEAEDGSNQDQD